MKAAALVKTVFRWLIIGIPAMAVCWLGLIVSLFADLSGWRWLEACDDWLRQYLNELVEAL